MSMLTVELQIPSDVTNWLNVSKTELPYALQNLIAMGLFREGHISAGKGAEILGIRKWDFIQLLSKHGVVYIDLSPEEALSDIEAIRKFLDEKNVPRRSD